MNLDAKKKEKLAKQGGFLLCAALGAALAIGSGMIFITVALPALATAWAPLALASMFMLAVLAVSGLATVEICLSKACCSPHLSTFSADASISALLRKKHDTTKKEPGNPAPRHAPVLALSVSPKTADRPLRLR